MRGHRFLAVVGLRHCISRPSPAGSELHLTVPPADITYAHARALPNQGPTTSQRFASCSPPSDMRFRRLSYAEAASTQRTAHAISQWSLSVHLPPARRTPPNGDGCLRPGLEPLPAIRFPGQVSTVDGIHGGCTQVSGAASIRPANQSPRLIQRNSRRYGKTQTILSFTSACSAVDTPDPVVPNKALQ